MAQNNDRVIFALFEELIKNTKLVEYYPYNHCIDFKPGDVVQCSYMRGFFKVVGLYNSYIALKVVNSATINPDMIAYVGPHFIKKVELNQQVMKVLFNETD